MTTCISTGDARQDPAGDLPVAANPAMPSTDVRAVAGRKLLVQLHVAQQARPRVAAFEKVVTQDPVQRQAARQRALEGIDVVDALADERAFTEHILIDIGNGSRIRIDARLTAEKPRVSRPVGAGQAHRDTRLKNAVAAGDPSGRAISGHGVEPRDDSADAPSHRRIVARSRAAIACRCRAR